MNRLNFTVNLEMLKEIERQWLSPFQCFCLPPIRHYGSRVTQPFNIGKSIFYPWRWTDQRPGRDEKHSIYSVVRILCTQLCPRMKSWILRATLFPLNECNGLTRPDKLGGHTCVSAKLDLASRTGQVNRMKLTLNPHVCFGGNHSTSNS